LIQLQEENLVRNIYFIIGISCGLPFSAFVKKSYFLSNLKKIGNVHPSRDWFHLTFHKLFTEVIFGLYKIFMLKELTFCSLWKCSFNISYFDYLKVIMHSFNTVSSVKLRFPKISTFFLRTQKSLHVHPSHLLAFYDLRLR
jgi:hypothetical protein